MKSLAIIGFVAVVVVAAAAGGASGQSCDAWPVLGSARVRAGFCANVWTTGLTRPRAIRVDAGGNVVIAERGVIKLLWDDNNDGTSDAASERMVLVEQTGLNHEVMLDGGFLYASSDTTVYRWPYNATRVPITTPAEVVVAGIPSGGNHPVRTLAARGSDLFVHVGSAGNVDADSSRSRVAVFDLEAIPTGGHAWSDHTVYADGLRNEVGINFDQEGVLWGVQNGRDNLQHAPWGNIKEDNPCEEINAYLPEDAGAHYGYPYCWSDTGEDPITGTPAGTQYADTQYFANVTNEWCRDRANNIPPRWCMPAHTAPLGFTFYHNQGNAFSFPAAMDGDMFVTLHGSWNRIIPAGYMLRHIDFEGGQPVADEPLVEYDGANPPGAGIGWIRPVDAAVLPDGTLVFTSDNTGTIVAVRYLGAVAHDRQPGSLVNNNNNLA